jgi:H+/Cl- antiporter ClcA
VLALGSFNIIYNFREYIARDAEGSGVPEMKAILAGVHLHNFLSIRAFIGKWVGMVASIGGGLSMGR